MKMCMYETGKWKQRKGILKNQCFANNACHLQLVHIIEEFLIVAWRPDINICVLDYVCKLSGLWENHNIFTRIYIKLKNGTGIHSHKIEDRVWNVSDSMLANLERTPSDLPYWMKPEITNLLSANQYLAQASRLLQPCSVNLENKSGKFSPPTKEFQTWIVWSITKSQNEMLRIEISSGFMWQ